MKFKAWFLVLLATGSLQAADNIAGHIGYLNNQFNGDVGDVVGNKYNGNFSFDYHKLPAQLGDRTLESRFTTAGLINSEGLFMYSVQEMYVAGSITDKDHIKFGRHILDWSAVDATWGFGKLNNRRNFDYFEPGQEGLIGLQYERKSTNNMRYKLFVSGLYVPELNPGLDINKSKKTIGSKNPWANPPEPTAEVTPGINEPIRYNVNYPGVDEVIFKYSFGFNIGYEDKNWVFDNFYIRKPENTLTPKVEASFDPITSVIFADITPEFYYHDVYGSTLKYRNLDLEMYLSAIAIRPNTFPDGGDIYSRYTQIETEKVREDYVGGGISKVNDLYGVGFNYVARLSPYDRKADNLTLDPRWNQAVNVFLTRNFGSRFSLASDLKYDTLTSDRLVMVRGTYKASDSLLISAGMNLIGTPSDGKSFWSEYTNNDSLYGSLRYVF